MNDLRVLGFAHRYARYANQGQHHEQHQFGRIVEQAREDIRIYWTA